MSSRKNAKHNVRSRLPAHHPLRCALYTLTRPPQPAHSTAMSSALACSPLSVSSTPALLSIQPSHLHRSSWH